MDALVTLLILVLAIALFAMQALPPEVVGLLAMGLLMASGVLSPAEALAGFASPAVITLLAMFAPLGRVVPQAAPWIACGS